MLQMELKTKREDTTDLICQLDELKEKNSECSVTTYKGAGQWQC